MLVTHLVLGCPSAYSSRVLYIKERQVWKSQSETDWPHLGIMPGFSTEKNCNLLILTSTCWQDISLSNTVELTTVTPQKQKICCFKCHFLPIFENSSGSIVCLRAANPVTRHDWVILFLCTSAGCHTETGTYVKTKLPNRGTSQDLLRVGRQWNLWNFRKSTKKRLKRHIFCFCGVTVVSSTVFEREMSCQHVDVKMRRLRFFSVEKPGIIPRCGQSVSDWDFHTCLFFMYDTLLL